MINGIEHFLDVFPFIHDGWYCRIRLYEAKDKPTEAERDICQVVHDLQHIDTNCTIQAFGGSPAELGLCLQVF